MVNNIYFLHITGHNSSDRGRIISQLVTIQYNDNPSWRYCRQRPDGVGCDRTDNDNDIWFYMKTDTLPTIFNKIVYPSLNNISQVFKCTSMVYLGMEKDI